MAAERYPYRMAFPDGNILMPRPGATGESQAIDGVNLNGRSAPQFRGVAIP